MKTKKIMMAVFVMAVTVAANAQHEVGTWTIQPKLGFNLTNLYNNSPNDTDIRMGAVLGAEVEYRVAKRVGLAVGLIYSQQGFKDESSISYSVPEYVDGDIVNHKYNYDLRETLKLDYINIPITVNYYVADKVALKLGVQFGFCVNSRDQWSTRGIGHEAESAEISDMGYDVLDVDFSIPIGVSYEFGNCVVDARYQLGLMHVVHKDTAKNSVFQLTLGYKFAL